MSLRSSDSGTAFCSLNGSKILPRPRVRTEPAQCRNPGQWRTPGPLRLKLSDILHRMSRRGVKFFLLTGTRAQDLPLTVGVGSSWSDYSGVRSGHPWEG